MEWDGFLTPDGYGRGLWMGRQWLAHRRAWAEAHGDPGDLHVLHKCDNRACVNVDHLFLGTNDDNVADKVSKGRQHHPVGELHGRSKLTDQSVLEIRGRLAAGERQADIATSVGVSVSTISHIKNGRKWAHV